MTLTVVTPGHELLSTIATSVQFVERDKEGMRLMKTMTCKQLDGPCDFTLRGETADEVIKAQDRHLKEMVAGGDESHAGALKDMRGRWKNPIAAMGWYKKAKREFAALSEE